MAALDVHDLGVGGGGFRGVEERVERQTEAVGEDEALGEGGAVEAENVVDRELGARAVAECAHVDRARADRGEDISDRFRSGGVAGDEAVAVALRDLMAGA